jgi:hypothetical protein
MESSSSNTPATLPSRNEYVFLNYPFDKDYEPLLNAMMLAVLSCGLVPRSADEGSLGSGPRLERICKVLQGSRFSIHDLCRCTGEGEKNEARFNMPLELGITMGHKYATSEDSGQAHDWFVLTPDGHPHDEYISDLAGIDPETHKETPKSIIAAVMKCLLTSQRSAGVYSNIKPADVAGTLPQLEAALKRLEDDQWLGVKPPWEDRVIEGRSVIAALLSEKEANAGRQSDRERRASPAPSS